MQNSLIGSGCNWQCHDTSLLIKDLKLTRWCFTDTFYVGLLLQWNSFMSHYRINTATKFQCVRCLFKDALIEIPTLPPLIQYPNIPACSKVSLQILHTVFISQFYLLRLSFHFFLSFRNVERAANSMIHWFSSETFSAIHFFSVRLSSFLLFNLLSFNLNHDKVYK